MDRNLLVAIFFKNYREKKNHTLGVHFELEGLSGITCISFNSPAGAMQIITCSGAMCLRDRVNINLNLILMRWRIDEVLTLVNKLYIDLVLNHN